MIDPKFQREIDEICARMVEQESDDDSVAWIVVAILAGLMCWVAIGLVIWP